MSLDGDILLIVCMIPERKKATLFTSYFYVRMLNLVQIQVPVG
jgi:hypothetical protein